VTGDSIVAPGANYVATTGARLLLDTAIVPGGRSDFLTVGTTSGVTSVAIRDTAPTGFGAYNPTGIVVVNGATHAGDFVLDAGSSFYNAGVFGGAIDKPGLFFSQLGVNAAGQTVLVSLPKVQAYQFSTLASQAQAAWYETAPRAARQAEVRDQLAAGERAGGFWVDVQGTHTAREVDRYEPTLAGVKHYDASYGQDLTAATIGIDAVRPMMDGDVVFGASVGYVNSSADFDKQSTSIDMDGWSASAYATFVRGGWFVAGTIGANQLNAEIKAPRLAGFTQRGHRHHLRRRHDRGGLPGALHHGHGHRADGGPGLRQHLGGRLRGGRFELPLRGRRKPASVAGRACLGRRFDRRQLGDTLQRLGPRGRRGPVGKRGDGRQRRSGPAGSRPVRQRLRRGQGGTDQPVGQRLDASSAT
jgi:hypothetical protein